MKIIPISKLTALLGTSAACCMAAVTSMTVKAGDPYPGTDVCYNVTSFGYDHDLDCDVGNVNVYVHNTTNGIYLCGQLVFNYHVGDPDPERIDFYNLGTGGTVQVYGGSFHDWNATGYYPDYGWAVNKYPVTIYAPLDASTSVKHANDITNGTRNLVTSKDGSTGTVQAAISGYETIVGKLLTWTNATQDSTDGYYAYISRGTSSKYTVTVSIKDYTSGATATTESLSSDVWVIWATRTFHNSTSTSTPSDFTIPAGLPSLPLSAYPYGIVNGARNNGEITQYTLTPAGVDALNSSMDYTLTQDRESQGWYLAGGSWNSVGYNTAWTQDTGLAYVDNVPSSNLNMYIFDAPGWGSMVRDDEVVHKGRYRTYVKVSVDGSANLTISDYDLWESQVGLEYNGGAWTRKGTNLLQTGNSITVSGSTP